MIENISQPFKTSMPLLSIGVDKTECDVPRTFHIFQLMFLAIQVDLQLILNADDKVY